MPGALQVGLWPQRGQPKAPFSPSEPVCLWEEEELMAVLYPCPQESWAQDRKSVV